MGFGFGDRVKVRGSLEVLLWFCGLEGRCGTIRLCFRRCWESVGCWRVRGIVGGLGYRAGGEGSI